MTDKYAIWGILLRMFLGQAFPCDSIFKPLICSIAVFYREFSREILSFLDKQFDFYYAGYAYYHGQFQYTYG